VTSGGGASWRTRNPWRRLGYRLLPGDGFSYLLHLRPAEWPIMAAHTALGFLLAVGIGPAARGEQAGGGLFALSLAYSVPPLRLKAVGGVDWLINMVGFGTLTPYPGWAATGRALEPAYALVLVAFCPLFAALYPLTQLYQFEEDQRRGDRTLALILGMSKSLWIAVLATLVAFALLGWAAALRGAASWQWVGLLLALAAWLRVLLPWTRRWGEMSPAEHQRGMYAALGAWAVTDIAVLAAFAVPG
jgi:1,4-dihydroxy-2-naphthoate octaprenyltransferase